ncbi:hypothetical protein AB0A63_18380 [Lentzea sp. NPDC042327]|uniref:hypothetical protein n=1 Tax=Lentzea sp. NPDC042327 TaxID=3154801 RepID=UPI0033C30758
MRTFLWCGAMNVVWLLAMAYGALQEVGHFDQRALLGTGTAWVLATVASWSLLRRSTRRHAVWEYAVVTAPAALVALVLVTTGAWFVSPPGPGKPLA